MTVPYYPYYPAGSYHFEALVFAEPSQYGIDGGQVSKLYLWEGAKRKRGKVLAVYERGWELEPEEEVRGVVETLVAELSRREREGRQTEEYERAQCRDESETKPWRRGPVRYWLTRRSAAD